MYKPTEVIDAARRYKAYAKEYDLYEKTEERLAQINMTETVTHMDKKYMVLGKALIDMRQACREAVVEEEKYEEIHHKVEEVPKGSLVDIATKRWEVARKAFLAALAAIEKR